MNVILNISTLLWNILEAESRRFYDLDKHIIEVGENMNVVCRRFLDNGMTPEQVANRMNVPMKFINACMR